MSKSDWIGAGITLLLAGVSYFVGGPTAAVVAALIGLVILIVVHLKGNEDKPQPMISDALRVAAKDNKRNEVPDPDIQSQFTFEKTDASLEVTNTGLGADVWAPMKIEGMMKRQSGDVFARWTHTESVKTRIAKGQTCRLRIAYFEVNYANLLAQWVVYSTTENGAAEDRPMYSALLGNTDVQTPDIHIFVDVVSDPDNVSGIKRHHIVLRTRHAEEI